MKLNDKLFFPKETICPICEKSFTRYALRKAQFSISKRDVDYRPIYIGAINPRFFSICVCPNCYYAGEEKYFCPKMGDDDIRRKQFFASHKAQWEAQTRVKAAGSGQQVWKDMASEKLKELSPEEIQILRKIAPLLKKSAADIIAKGQPLNELQKEVDLDVAVRAYELAAICYKARRANHRILGYTYLNGAWASRDAAEMTEDPKKKADYKSFETAFLREAVSFLTITNKATSVEDQYGPDGQVIPKENMPQSRIYEILYILAGANRLLGNSAECNKYLEQILFGASSSATGIILWFIQQARDMRQSDSPPSSTGPVPEDEEDEDDSDEEE